jgi:DNA topoisomerase-1
MADARIERTNISIGMSNSPFGFTATGEVIVFDGFLRVYSESADSDNTDDERYVIPPVKNGMPLFYDKITATERFTLAPPRYTEASLVKKLEELGIGRPSTYAPTISTIQNRGYVAKEDRPGEKRKIRSMILSAGSIESIAKSEIAGKEKSKLFPKDIGMIVNDFLTENFKDIVDFNFTADVEEQFDKVADGEIKWTGMLKKFYTPFHKTVENALEKKDKKTGIRVLGNHPETGEPISVKMGRYGPVVQIGESTDENKPKFASLLKSQLIETITLEDALQLFRLPRSLGEHDGEDMVVGIGKFGPYVRYKSKFYSLRKGVDDPYTVTLESALELIQEKNDTEKQKVINDFGEIKVLNGRYGPYLTSGGKNFRIPKGTDPASLKKEDCEKIIENNNKTKS